MRGATLLVELVVVVAACNPSATGSASHSSAGPDASDVPPSITLSPDPIAIVGPAGVQATRIGDVAGAGGVSELIGLSISDPGFSFTMPACAMASCNFAPGIALPTQLAIVCTPGATPRFATITVLGQNAASDTVNVTCTQTANSPGLSAPNPNPVSSTVGVKATTQLTLTNTGNVALAVSFAISGAAANDWTTNQCVAPASCAIGVGATTNFAIDFTPSAHGARNAALQITSTPDAGTAFVTLAGTGLGGVLRVDQPASTTIPPFNHSFGTISKGQLSSFSVAMTNTGNQTITITPSPPTAPYTFPVAPIAVPANASRAFDVSCQSNAAGGPFPVTVMLAQSANTYQRNTSAIGFSCTIANTTTQVVPTPIDFGELRVGDAEKSLTVTVSNPPGGSASIAVTRIALRNAPGALLKDPPSIALPVTLGDGQSVTTKLALAADDELRLDDVALEVEVFETEQVVLAIPITGTVGKPRAVVVPEQLALGSVCVGTAAAGTVTMTNTGTVTLRVQRPSVTSTSFETVFANPTAYPDPPAGAPLRVSDSASVDVVPTTSATPGKLAATLGWNVDAPSAPFIVPVSLEFLASGTAVSPELMAFGSIDVGSRTAAQPIALENCGSVPVTITYGNVTARSGRADAWLLAPTGDRRTLNPNTTLQIAVAFVPHDAGSHEALLSIDVDGVEHVVTLTGNAVGVGLDETSFYACSCGGSDTPAPSWPIAIAVAFACGRRGAKRSRRT